MVKKRLESSPRGKRPKRKKAVTKKPAKRKSASRDLVLPELSDRQLGQMKRFGRPLIGMTKRQLISIRIDPDVLFELKKAARKRGKGYQSLINDILAKFVKAA